MDMLVGLGLSKVCEASMVLAKIRFRDETVGESLGLGIDDGVEVDFGASNRDLYATKRSCRFTVAALGSVLYLCL